MRFDWVFGCSHEHETLRSSLCLDRSTWSQWVRTRMSERGIKPMEQKNMSKRDARKSKVALIYCRVSTKSQEEEGTSLDSQAQACVAHAETLGYAVGRVTREVFTGAELWDRPLLARDRADIKQGE